MSWKDEEELEIGGLYKIKPISHIMSVEYSVAPDLKLNEIVYGIYLGREHTNLTFLIGKYKYYIMFIEIKSKI